MPEGAHFCWNCGHPLGGDADVEERRLVTVIFADLEGFTARSERADPEEMSHLLGAFHAQARSDVEHFGGRVEKLLGDGLLAVFGAPLAHEDDPERAVRAALRVQQSVSDLNASDPMLDLAVRIGVNTGEALVRMKGTRTDREGLIGDVVNTASRLQAVAPVGGVVVGPETYAATRSVIEYEEQEPVRLKGKAGLVPIWVADRPRGTIGIDADERDEGPFVGRRAEIQLLADAFDRMAAGALQLVTITGEPGVGKTRLVREFRRRVDDLPEVVWWRQGRCLPYGDGITFSALTEVVRAHAGILESDDTASARKKLETSVAQITVELPERDWMVRHLGALIGIGDAGDDERREEAFGAWLGFLTALAAARPLVLVIEDLHWADDPQIEFLDYVLHEGFDTPLLLVCAARPELFDRRPGWGGGIRNATSLRLGPLGAEETEELLAGLTDVELRDDERNLIVRQSGGNPLYAGEYVRMMRDRRDDPADPAGAVPTPGSLEQLISARLDLLDRDQKALVQGAAVVGKVFWPSAVATVLEEGSEEEIESGMRALARKELVQAMRPTSPGEGREYSFRHALIRDVAYAQIPRRIRGPMHLRVADWIERQTGGPAADHAELKAHHLRQALDLTDRGEMPASLPSRAREALLDAGRRTRNLNASRSLDYHREALALTSNDDPQWPHIMLATGALHRHRARFEEAEIAYLAAIDAFEAREDLRGKGTALHQYAELLWRVGRPEHRAVAKKAVDILDKYPPSAELARALTTVANNERFAGDDETAIEMADRVLEMAESLDARPEAIRALQLRGSSRASIGDLEAGLEDLRSSLDQALDLGDSRLATLVYNNYANELGLYVSPKEGLAISQEGAQFGERRGMLSSAAWAKLTSSELAFWAGEWDIALQLIAEVAAELEGLGTSQVSVAIRTWESIIACAQGRLDDAATHVDAIVEMTRAVRDVQWSKAFLMGPAQVAMDAGDTTTAVGLIEEWAARVRGDSHYQYEMLAEATRLLIACERPHFAAECATGPEPRQGLPECNLLSAQGLLAEAEGDHDVAARLLDRSAAAWGTFGGPYERAQALAAEGRCRVRLEEPEGATAAFTEALRIGEKLGSQPLVAECRKGLEALR